MPITRWVIYCDSAEYTQARQHYQQALTLRRQLVDSDGIAGALNNLGIVAAWLGDYDGALALHTESLELRQARRDAFDMAMSYSTSGMSCLLKAISPAPKNTKKKASACDT